MRITATEEYGLRCLVLLARCGPGEPLTIGEIGESEGLSQPYAAKILNLLRQAGLVDSIRGRNGGYVLADNPERIKLTEVFSALGEPLFGKSHCDRFGGAANRDPCVHHGDCSIRDVWAGMQHIVEDLLERVTLADLINASTGEGLSIVTLAKQQLESQQTKNISN